MELLKTTITFEEFEQIAALPENAERILELIDGEIFEKMPSNLLSSRIATRIARFIDQYLDANPIGHVTGEAGLYRVFQHNFAPDVGYISKERLPELDYEHLCPLSPDLAVEVVSASDREKNLAFKIGNYLAAQTVIWVVYPVEKEVHVYVAGEPVQTLDISGVLDGGKVLPGFQLAVKEIFPQ
ncbi:MAG: Uma2 family endonuclease [Chloroflexi bacterium]|nr:Uma2 family endonuclease [Chloroflexota bacterium]